jgi:hypothetical protein
MAAPVGASRRRINFWARLHDGDRAHKLLGEQPRLSTLSNLFETHPPFQIDGNFGATARLTGMLLQSQGGGFELLPALPAQWSSGDVRGLRTRGRLSINIKWQDRSRLNARSWRTAASTIFCVAEPVNSAPRLNPMNPAGTQKCYRYRSRPPIAKPSV